MRTVFISYNRANRLQAQSIMDDVEALGHLAWMDQELSGGQKWWDQILERVRASDIFLLAVTAESLSSEACRRELAYAHALAKPILPAIVADGVSTNLLPPQIAALQLIDLRRSDRESALRLGRALSNLPATPALPQPLPAEPEVPLSYLGRLAERVGSDEPLDFDTQSSLLVSLKAALRDVEVTADARQLLVQLRRRRHLYAEIAEQGTR